MNVSKGQIHSDVASRPAYDGGESSGGEFRIGSLLQLRYPTFRSPGLLWRIQVKWKGAELQWVAW
jgi:hypothetical protein